MSTPRGLDRAALGVMLALVVLPALCGCGGGAEDRPSARPPEPLSAGEQADARRAQLEIHSYCRELNLYLARRRGPPTDEETARAYEAVDRLAAIARAKPSATYAQSGRTARELLGDLAEDLEGSNCAANVVSRIDRVRATLPAQ